MFSGLPWLFWPSPIGAQSSTSWRRSLASTTIWRQDCRCSLAGIVTSGAAITPCCMSTWKPKGPGKPSSSRIISIKSCRMLVWGWTASGESRSSRHTAPSTTTTPWSLSSRTSCRFCVQARISCSKSTSTLWLTSPSFFCYVRLYSAPSPQPHLLIPSVTSLQS